MSVIIGTNADNVLVGSANSDIITGANGNDQIDGGAGNDTIDGGNGNDTILGGAGSDVILGGNGNDTLDGGAGGDLVSGGNGNDLLIYRTAENVGAVDIYDGGAGQDTLRLIIGASQYTAAVQADIARLQTMLSQGSASTILSSLNLAVTSIERLEVVVENGNHAPTAADDSAATSEDTAVTISAATLLANDTDPDSGDSKTLVSVQGAQHGTVALNGAGNVVFTPAQNFSGVASFTYTMRDTAGATSTATVLVNVGAVADAPTLSVANAAGNEDSAISLAITPALTDTDGSEHLSALVVSAIPVGATLTDGAGHTFTASIGHTSVDVNSWTLSGLRITPPANSDADFTLTVTATSQEGTSGPTASTSSNLIVTVNPVAGTPSLSVANATGNEDSAISLAITPALTDTDGSEHLAALVVSAIPIGATLSDGAGHSFTASIGHTSVEVNSWTLSSLTITPPANSDVDFTLTVTATSQEGSSGPTASTSTDLVVTVNPVADVPLLSTTAASGAADVSIPLSITVSLTDTSETLGPVDIQGVPSGFALNNGTLIDDGHWVVSATDLPTLALVPTNGAAMPGDFVLHVTATSIDGASVASATADLDVTVSAGASQHSGRVIDGYVAGATVFADANGNGVLDAGEAHTTTNGDGTFTLSGGSGNLVMFGGTDVSTGLAFQGVLTAPEDSTVVTPLTTLVTQIAASNGGDLAAAQVAVATAFGFDSSIDLQTFDAVSAALSNDPNATAVLSAAIQVQSTVVQISAVGGTTDGVYSAIVDAITASHGATVDLSQPDTVSSIASQSGVDAAAVAVVTDVVTAANSSIQSATDLTTLAQAAQVAQGDATAALATTDFSNPGDVAALTDTYVDNLATQVDNAQVGDVDGALTGTLGDDVLTGGNGVDAIDGLDGNDQISGGAGDDLLYGGAGNDTLIGGAGNDRLDGGTGRDKAVYTDATGAISVEMVAGTVSGAGVGTDTLVSIDYIRGSNYADTYVATGYSGNDNPGTPATVNTFEGMGGDDQIIGNGDTQLSYASATAAVTVDFALGTAGGDASVGTDHFSGVNRVRGSDYADTLLGSNNQSGVEQFSGGAGNDFIDGRGGFDRASYTLLVDNNVTGPITVNLAAGTVTGDASVGTDTLRSVEAIRGTAFNDVYNATGFTASSTNAGSAGTNAAGAAFNEFEGMGGNDIITGNGNTRIAFYNATAAVTVDLAAGTATGDSSVGSDTITGGVNSVVGSQFGDTLYGSNNAANTSEVFEGRGGNDFFDGRGGFDQALYGNDTAVTTGITVDMAAGIVTGDAAVGTDTLSHIESIRGTNFADTYVATGFNGSSANAGSSGTLNEFEGLGGNDTITGNGDTRITFTNATAGVTVDLAAGTAIGNASVGTDTFTGVARVRGSNFNDTISGDGGTNTLEGQGGNDRLDGRGGNDTLIGGVGADTFVYGSGTDIVTDFSHGQGDVIDLTAMTAVHSLSDLLAIASPSGANTVVNFGGGNTLTLSNVTLSNLVASDFVFAPVNHPPTDIALSANSVPENSANGTVVGSLSAIDPDAGDTATFTLLDNAGGLFAINGTNLVVAGALDFETATSHQVTVRVTDSGNNTYDETFVVGVTDVNEAPTDIALSNATVAENSANGTVVGSLSAIDPDAGDTATFTLLDDAGGRFAINGTDLVVVGSLDYETATSHQVTVRVTDSGSNTYDETFVVGVTDVLGVTVNGDNNNNTLTGTNEQDTLNGLGGNDALQGFGANDVLNGGSGNDRATYTDATGGISVNLAAGTVTGPGVGTDTLQSIEFVTGSEFVDAFVATGFSGSSANAGNNGTFNEFEGRGGDDVITGNGNTRVSYLNAAAAVTVDILAGTGTGIAAGDAAHVGTDTFTGVSDIRGSNFADTLFGSNNASGAQGFEGRGGNDTIDGRGGFDRAIYNNDTATTTGISIDMASGIVTGDSTVGTDTLLSVEAIRGTNFADTYVATGFTASSANAGSAGTNASGAAFNEFEGMGGNDTITGNGNTRIAFYNATAAVTVDLVAGTATGDSSVGTDTITGGVISVTGSQFNDTLSGSNNAANTSEQFEGRGGNDVFDGRGGFDQAVYGNDTAVTTGITVDMAAGTVTGDAAVGTDTFNHIESIRGTNFADTYVATGFSGSSTNAGSSGTLNEFEGLGGNDTITGNGDTRITFTNATAGVTVDLAAGTAIGDASVGTDTFSGVSRVRGSNFNDTISGGSGNNTLEGQNGNDTLTGRGGNDTLTGGTGADHFVFTATTDGLDHITDFSGHGGQNDVLDFSHLAFGNGLASGGTDTGTLDTTHFVANATGSTTAAEVFWYNTTDHTLYYDADGSGAGAAVAIAVLDNLFTVNNTDIHLV
jgi:Ca2+-binding RTX toxin-like protein